MGNNSIFDEMGIGASDLGLAVDPDKVEKDAKKAVAKEKRRMDEEKRIAEEEAFKREDAARTASRSRTVLTGGRGLSDDSLNVARRTLIGS